MTSDRHLSATEVFIDAVEKLCVHGARLEHVTEAAAALHDASALATAGTATLARLLHLFRARAGSRSAEWWIATLEGATALPSDVMLDVLVVLAADAGGVAVPEIAAMERATFVTAYLQLAAVIVMLIHFYGGQAAPVTLQLLRDQGATTGV
jgi:hypothetical protein